jgi:hypothetical protein
MNVWPTEAFWRNIGIGAIMAQAELMPMVCEQDAVESGVMIAWFIGIPPAGSA